MRTLRASLVTVLSVVGWALSASSQTLSRPPASTQVESSQAQRNVRRLSVDEAVRLALDQNLNIQVERLNPQIQDLSMAVARTPWTPNLTAAVNNGRLNVPTNTIFAGTQGTLTREERGATVGWEQLLPWGASYKVAWDNSRVRSNTLFDSPNPALSSTLTGSYAQPLLRNFRIDSARQQLRVTKANREISDIELTQTLLHTVRNVKVAYWNLAYAMSSLLVRQQSLELARASLRNSRSRLEAGMMAPLDVVEAESEVAQREEAAIVAGAAVEQTEDRLRALLFDPAMPKFWDVKLEPTDAARVQTMRVDTEAATKNALSKRTDLLSARKNVEITDVNIRYFQNQGLPDVRAQVDHGLAGQGGTALQFGQGFPPSVIGQQSTGYGPVFRNLIDNESWRVSLSVSYPIGASAAEANVARARLERTQAETRIRNLELQIATEVRDAGRQVNTNAKRADATKAARQLAERRLESEEKKFAAGLSTSFLVFQAQRDLAQARNAELRATLDYNTSVVEFDVIQEAPAACGILSPTCIY